MRIWLFNEPYVRFTAQDYDPSKMNNKFMHLTNATLNKDGRGGNGIKTEGKYKITEDMWSLKEMQFYLN
eukprot:CAMPEP_0116886290 /NCGR_PEP_ID=MMETSP0463-20121206/20041_1 /TAXON_ID=181622 /ORGANISM="Strombidinopsis sp, Strain SopsisLIS2011" /LENGTH=68 /DNA_ID=CAMNT_0004546365 /DNA_START=162 /DNA_END=368 /DNA_ORIENTATION=-